jgi:hypothetical protein
MRYILGFIMLLNFGFLSAQKTPSPVKWDFEVKKVDNSTVEIIATATMKTSWVIYSQFTEDDGPIPTSFIVNGKEEQFEELSSSKTEYDELFEVNVTKFAEKAIFSKRVDIGQSTKWDIEVEYMTCDGERCLPPTIVEKSLSI